MATLLRRRRPVGLAPRHPGLRHPRIRRGVHLAGRGAAVCAPPRPALRQGAAARARALGRAVEHARLIAIKHKRASDAARHAARPVAAEGAAGVAAKGCGRGCERRQTWRLTRRGGEAPRRKLWQAIRGCRNADRDKRMVQGNVTILRRRGSEKAGTYNDIRTSRVCVPSQSEFEARARDGRSSLASHRSMSGLHFTRDASASV
mmetsp:Transcript_29516/g.81038  ORF Transcript_29516/g.81038 Transcript_29516/m.81038 type:complete len:204 (-) Transcript_29516:29-640(-)